MIEQPGILAVEGENPDPADTEPWFVALLCERCGARLELADGTSEAELTAFVAAHVKPARCPAAA